ncbi:MAG TPA: type IV pilus biogenesis/stability protein PilW [Steroidobacteraceae bacterium]
MKAAIRLLAALPALWVAACVTTSTGSGATTPGQVNAISAAGYNLQLGYAYMEQGNLSQAQKKLDKAQLENPADAHVRSAQGVLAERLGNDKLAESEYKTAIAMAPKDAEVVNAYAVYLCHKGRTDAGVKYFDAAATNGLYSTPWAALTNAGVCLHRAGRDAEAQTHFERALMLQPSYGEAVLELSGLKLAQKDPATAYRYVDGFLTTHTATPEILFNGWLAARALNDATNGERYAKRLQSEFPASDQAHRVVAVAPGTG